MFSRRQEQIIVFLILVAANAALGWYLHRQWKNYQSRVGWIYGGVSPAEASSSSTSRARAAEAQTFAEIVNRNLFRPDRSNESAAENVKMPELPYLYGTMNLGNGSFALMSPGDQAPGLSKRVVPGDEIGGYKLVSIAGSQVIVQWGEKKTSIDVSESARRIPRIKEVAAAPRTPAPAPVGGTSAAQVTTVAPTDNNSGQNGTSKAGFAGFGAPSGVAADAPVGTVVGGKKKVVRQTMFGPTYWWEDVAPAKPATGNENPK
ncbi:MAG TPA: hypothetical protein VKV95_18410 [Terriglobia bacterium]|nr:hypothetical protein [Terriglobia bacterium]